MASWSDDEIELLKKLWGEGLTATSISRLMNGKSRCAVLGKTHRLGLSFSAATREARYRRSGQRRSAALAAKRGHKPAHDAAPRPAFVPLPSCPEPVIPEGQRLRIHVIRNGKLCANDALTADRCRWPIGDPQSPEFHFCGCETEVQPYCAAHRERAYVPPKQRRRALDGVEVAAPQPEKQTA